MVRVPLPSGVHGTVVVAQLAACLAVGCARLMAGGRALPVLRLCMGPMQHCWLRDYDQQGCSRYCQV